MDLMEKIKAECDRNVNCKTCKLVKSNGRCSLSDTPSEWSIKATSKALGETSDKASDKEEIVVPKKWSKGFPEVVAKKPKEAVLMLFEQQNKIIKCLGQIKEVLK